MLAPSWKQTMNYESIYMDATEMVDSTYEAGADIARIKGEFGITSKEEADETVRRIDDARRQMHRLDDLIDAHGGDWDAAREAFNREIRLAENESTVAKKTDLNWPFKLKPVNITSNAKLLFQMIGGTLAALPKGDIVSAASDFDYPEQTNGTLSPLKYPLVGGTLTPEPSRAPGHDPEPASEGDLFNRGFMELEDEVLPAGEAPLVDDLPPAVPGSPADVEEHGRRPGVDAGKAR